LLAEVTEEASYSDLSSSMYWLLVKF
jgi:hypothetical protein